MRLNRFSNGNPVGSKINGLRFINEDDQALLMTGSSDGVLKIFRGYESGEDAEVVTAFRALSDLIPSNKNAGLVFDWQQGQGKALVAGDVKVIKVWNAGTEVCTNVRPPLPLHIDAILTNPLLLGDICTFRFLHHIVDIRPSRRKYFHSWIRRRRHPRLRPTVKIHHRDG